MRQRDLKKNKQEKQYLYMIQNKINFRIYIGISNNYIERFSVHKRRSTNINLRKEMSQYGENNFFYEILKIYDTRAEVLKAEIDAINYYINKNCELSKELYNIQVGGSDPPRSLKNKYNYPELAKMYNVNRTTIGMIIRREGIYSKI